MDTLREQIEFLSQKLEVLKREHKIFSNRIIDLENEIVRLKSMESFDKTEVDSYESPFVAEIKNSHPIEVPNFSDKSTHKQNVPLSEDVFNLEKFIGENLLSKIGILITIGFLYL